MKKILSLLVLVSVLAGAQNTGSPMPYGPRIINTSEVGLDDFERVPVMYNNGQIVDWVHKDSIGLKSSLYIERFDFDVLNVNQEFELAFQPTQIERVTISNSDIFEDEAEFELSETTLTILTELKEGDVVRIWYWNGQANTTSFSKLESDHRYYFRTEGEDLEQIVEAIADGTGGKAYPDLTTAMAVTPLPDDGVIFTIDESNESEKGVYAYDSGEVEGYRFVRGFADGLIQEDDSRPVSGDVAFKYLNEFEITEGTSVDLTTFSTNGSGSQIRVNNIPVQNGGLISSLTANVNTAGSGALMIFEKDGTNFILKGYAPITFESTGIQTINVESFELEVVENDYIGIYTSPMKVKTRTLTSGAYSISYPLTLGEGTGTSTNLEYAYTVDVIIPGLVTGINESVEQSKNQISDISHIVQSTNLIDKHKLVLDEIYINENGSVTSSSGRGRTDKIPCLPNTEYTLNGGDDNYSNLIYWDAFGMYDSYEILGSGIDSQFTTPATAHYIGINFANNNASTYVDTLQLNEGGEVLPYEEYYMKRMIKEEALPSGGGEDYDQSLNTTDSVEFDSIRTNGLELDLPTSPTGLSPGRIWIDTANGNVLKIVTE